MIFMRYKFINEYLKRVTEDVLFLEKLNEKSLDNS
jgi:hypothetical protein